MDNTQLKRLPSRQGIKNLKRLSIKNVTSLLTLPDAKIFENIKRVDVTYSMQCCAFQKVSLERESKFNASKIQSSKEESKKNCTDDITGDIYDDKIGSMEMDKSLVSDNDSFIRSSNLGLDHEPETFKDIMHQYMNAIYLVLRKNVNTLPSYFTNQNGIRYNPHPKYHCPHYK